MIAPQGPLHEKVRFCSGSMHANCGIKMCLRELKQIADLRRIQRINASGVVNVRRFVARTTLNYKLPGQQRQALLLIEYKLDSFAVIPGAASSPLRMKLFSTSSEAFQCFPRVTPKLEPVKANLLTTNSQFIHSEGRGSSRPLTSCVRP